MTNLRLELIATLRFFRHHPSFTALVVLTLGLGIGATTAIFAVVDGVLLTPFDYHDPHRLVALFRSEPRRGLLRNPTSPADFHDWRQESRTLELMTAAHPWAPVLTGRDRPDRLDGLKASASLFTLLGVEPMLGRGFVPEDGDPGAESVVVLGYELWQRRFGGDRDLLGDSLTLDGVPMTVVGIMSPGFQFPPFWAVDAEMWTPLVLTFDESGQRGAQFLRVFARLRAGATVQKARNEMDALASQLEAAYPATNTGAGINLEPLEEPVVGHVRPSLLVLLVAVFFLLWISCVNVAHLLMVRASSRHREMTIRVALGADRRRLLRQLLTEASVLAVLGAALGLVIAFFGLVLLQWTGPENIPRLDQVIIGWRAAAFSLTIGMASTLVFGLAPAWGASERGLPGATRAGEPRAHGRLREYLLTAEVALTLVLLVGAGLLLRSFMHLDRRDPGFATENLMTFDISLTGSPHASPDRQTVFFDGILDSVRGLPGVEEAALVNHLPVGGDLWSTPFSTFGPAVSQEEETPRAAYRTVSRDYLAAMGMSLASGEWFRGGERAESPGVVVINETMARRYFAGVEPVGQRLKLGGPDSAEPWLQIRGVVRDARQWSVIDDVRPEIYFPYPQNPVAWWEATTLVVRTPRSPGEMSDLIRRDIWRLDGNLPVTHVRTMQDILHNDLWRPRFNAFLMMVFAGVASLLSGVGIYGVSSFAMARRRHEISVRLACGARPRDILVMMLGQRALSSLWGLVGGTVLALLLARSLSGLLHGVDPYDVRTLVAIPLFLFGVVLISSFVPAHRAATRDPLEALERE